MDSFPFRIIEHAVPCSYIREYPNATRSQADGAPLRLAIKQYVPIVPVADSEPNAVTIIATHATGIIKEAYEPLWSDLQTFLSKTNVKIRGIWIADASNHGASGILNEHIQGDDPGWFDLSRDLLQMINVFRAEIKRPILGIGHSMGGTALVNLSLIHPRLFAGLVLIEPMVQLDIPPGPVFAGGDTRKTDYWRDREEAEAALRKSKLYARMDPRVVQRVVKHGLRAVPTAVYPLGENVKEGAVTLATTKHQEVWALLRPNFTKSTLTTAGTVSHRDRLLAPDVDHATTGQYLFFRPEFGYMFNQIPHLRPRTLYMFGGKSPMSTPELQAAKLKATGSGWGGGGGVASGQVEGHCVPDHGHMLPLENVDETAQVVGRWIVRTLKKWNDDEQFLRRHDSQKSQKDGLVVSKKWVELMNNEATARRPRLDEMTRTGNAKL